jgi:hypothetical protein
MSQNRREQLIIICSLCCYAAYLVFGAVSHEAWRDEWQAINIARSFTSLPDLYARLRYEGHPVLWFLSIRAVWEIHPALASVQLLNGFFAVSAAGLVAFFAPWPLWLRLLAAFTGPVAWEYSIKARGYGLGWLLVVMLALLLRRPESRAKPWLVVFLAALCLNTTVFTGIIAFSLVAGWLWDAVSRKRLRECLVPLSLLCAASLGTLLLARPPVGAALGLAPEKVVNDGLGALSTMFAVALFPCHGLSWDYLPYVTAAAMVVVFFCFRDLCAGSSARVALASGWAACMVFVIYKSGVQPWYLWHVFLLPFAVSLAFEQRVPVKRSALVILALLSILGLNAGIREYLHDRVTAYSAAKSAAEGIKQAGFEQLPVVVFPDYYVASLSGYLGRPIYEGACRGEETYIRWFYKRASEIESFKCAVELARRHPEQRSLFSHVDILREDSMKELSAEYRVNLSLVGSFVAAGDTDYRYGTEEHFNIYLLTVQP